MYVKIPKVEEKLTSGMTPKWAADMTDGMACEITVQGHSPRT